MNRNYAFNIVLLLFLHSFILEKKNKILDDHQFQISNGNDIESEIKKKFFDENMNDNKRNLNLKIFDF